MGGIVGAMGKGLSIDPPSVSPVAAQYDGCIIAVSVSEFSDQEQPYMVSGRYSPLRCLLALSFGSFQISVAHSPRHHGVRGSLSAASVPAK